MLFLRPAISGDRLTTDATDQKKKKNTTICTYYYTAEPHTCQPSLKQAKRFSRYAVLVLLYLSIIRLFTCDDVMVARSKRGDISLPPCTAVSPVAVQTTKQFLPLFLTLKSERSIIPYNTIQYFVLSCSTPTAMVGRLTVRKLPTPHRVLQSLPSVVQTPLRARRNGAL